MRAGPRFTGPPVPVLRSQPAEITINVGWQKRVRSHFLDSARTTEPAVPASMKSPFFGRVAVPSEAHRAKDGGEGGIRISQAQQPKSFIERAFELLRGT